MNSNDHCWRVPEGMKSYGQKDIARCNEYAREQKPKSKGPTCYTQDVPLAHWALIQHSREMRKGEQRRRKSRRKTKR